MPLVTRKKEKQIDTHFYIFESYRKRLDEIVEESGADSRGRVFEALLDHWEETNAK